jgi:RNA polymerase sigma factor (sigma-70 family)
VSNCRDQTDPGVAETTSAALARVFREESGTLLAALVRILGDFDVAEELVQDAFVAAATHWPAEGIPKRPGAWLLTVARRRALDRLRRDARYRDKLPLLKQPIQREPDDRLRLIFTCCHPALARDAQIALTLRTVCGFSVAEIARAFVTNEATVAQRLARARRKIAEAGIPYRIPRAEDLDARLGEVLTVLYLVFSEGYLASAGDLPARRDLENDADWLAELLSKLLPDEPEVLGLLALIRLHRARGAARFDPEGMLIPLRSQDRSRWDHQAIAAASRLLISAGRFKRPGPFQIQAAIVACHAEALTWEATDWEQILALYDALLAVAPSPVASLNRAIAVRFVEGARLALDQVDALATALGGYRLFHATRAELLRDLGRPDEARLADARALALTTNSGERRLLEQRLS